MANDEKQGSFAPLAAKDYRALSYVAARAMMDRKDEQKWEVMHALARAKEACGHLDRAGHLLRQGILQNLRFLAPGLDNR